jgi:hypothetical protein
MFSKSLLAASNNYLRLKSNLGERRPSIVGHQDERRRSSFTERQNENHRSSPVGSLDERRRSFLIAAQGERRPSLFKENGEFHRAMSELREHLGQAGTTTQEIENLMGPPTKTLDQPDETLSYELKRNNEKYEYPQNAKIWIYQWRSNHDYVYFIISNDNKVIQSAWYYAFE